MEEEEEEERGVRQGKRLIMGLKKVKDAARLNYAGTARYTLPFLSHQLTLRFILRL